MLEWFILNRVDTTELQDKLFECSIIGDKIKGKWY